MGKATLENYPLFQELVNYVNKQVKLTKTTIKAHTPWSIFVELFSYMIILNLHFKHYSLLFNLTVNNNNNNAIQSNIFNFLRKHTLSDM